MARTIAIDQLEFILSPEPVQVPEPVQPTVPVETPKPQPRRCPSSPPCTASRGVMCSDGYSRMNYLAERYESKKNCGWLERWGIWMTFDE